MTHASKPIDAEERAREAMIRKELYERSAEHALHRVGTAFTSPPPQPEALRLYLCGELVSAWDFENDHLYIHTLIDVPEGWECISG